MKYNLKVFCGIICNSNRFSILLYVSHCISHCIRKITATAELRTGVTAKAFCASSQEKMKVQVGPCQLRNKNEPRKY